MNHVMVDIETMGIRPTSAIVQIGAVQFGMPEGIGGKFSRAVSLESSIAAGLTVDGSTVEWWLQQEDAARAAILTARVPLTSALDDFSEWFKKTGAKFIWANSPAFDCVILRHAYTATGNRAPFHFRQERCCRTLWALASGLGVETKSVKRKGAAHDAVSDALFQAESMQAAIQGIRKRVT